jgi:P2 family phage contractile tail tube protein
VAQIPERLINFRVYSGTDSLEQIGLADVELPRFESLTESIAGAGIAGDLESVVLGHFKTMVVKLKWLAPTAKAIQLLTPIKQSLDLRGSIQVQDAALGLLTSVPLRVACSGQIKSLGLGKFEPGKRMDSDTELEVAYISVSLDGVPLIELDKLNMVFKVNGFDYLRSVRQDMGGV